MIRKNGTVKVSQIFKVRAFIAQRTKEGWDQTYYMETVIIANPGHAYQLYMHELNKMKPDLFYNSETKKADCSLFVPHIHGDGSLAYWPENSKYIQRFKHNIE